MKGRKGNLNKKKIGIKGGKRKDWIAAQTAQRYAASQQIWLVEAGLLLGDFRALRDGLGALGTGGLGALGNSGALGRLCVHGNSTESEGSGGHQRHQFLHLAVLLWIAII
jgi:hypothetical protein